MSETFEGIPRSVYAELKPRDRHASFFDHLFVLRDHGRLTGVGRKLFASPFSELMLICERPDAIVSREAAAWWALHRPPSFGWRVRPRSFQGWMVGVRCQPLEPASAETALADSSERFGVLLGREAEISFDAMFNALDAWVDHLVDQLDKPCVRRRIDAKDATPIASQAASAGVAARTLQRRSLRQTGLTPKRYAAVRRFNETLSSVAQGQASLAELAAETGYCDQSHMTLEMSRHAGLPPGRFRQRAQREISGDAVRFFKDAELRQRLRLLVCDDEARRDDIPPKRPQLRDPRPD